MENGLDKKTEDKQIPEEELLEELDAMYRRVADIEKEEAEEVSTPGETALFLEPRIQAAPEKLKKKPGRNKKRDYRPIILATTAIILIFILAITFWKPMAIIQLLKIGDTPQPIVPPLSRPRKPPSVAATPTPLSLPPVGTSPASPKPTPEPFQGQMKQEAARSTREGAEKAKSISQEIVKPNRSIPQEKYFAVQLGSFRDIENVFDLTGDLRKEGLDAYWITTKNRKGNILYRVFVGQFTDKNEATRFLKDTKVLKNYPGGFIQEISASSSGP